MSITEVISFSQALKSSCLTAWDLQLLCNCTINAKTSAFLYPLYDEYTLKTSTHLRWRLCRGKPVAQRGLNAVLELKYQIGKNMELD